MISVLICTRNRADSLRKTLDSLLHAGNLKLPNWEVLVVENGSTDRTIAVCQELRQRFPHHFRFLTEDRIGKCYALNTAVAAAKGDVLAFIDDDVICSPDYIEGIRNVFISYPVDAAQGRVLLDCEAGWPEWLEGNPALMANIRDCGDRASELQGTLSGTNMAVRSEVFQRVGGFAPELGPGPGTVGMWEDTEISLRMRQAGCRMIYAPQILVRHRWPRGRLTKSLIRKRFFGQGRAQAYYDPLPVSLLRFGLYVAKETVHQEFAALWHLYKGRPARALECQCEMYSHAGFLWQHGLFRCGTPRKLTEVPIGSSGFCVQALERPPRE